MIEELKDLIDQYESVSDRMNILQRERKRLRQKMSEVATGKEVTKTEDDEFPQLFLFDLKDDAMFFLESIYNAIDETGFIFYTTVMENAGIGDRYIDRKRYAGTGWTKKEHFHYLELDVKKNSPIQKKYGVQITSAPVPIRVSLQGVTFKWEM